MWRNVAQCGEDKQKILAPHKAKFNHIQPQNDILKCGEKLRNVAKCG